MPLVTAPVRVADVRSRVAKVQAKFGAAMLMGNMAGAVIVFSYLGFILPRPQRFFIANLIALVAYNLLASAVCCVVSGWAFRPLVRFAREGRPATPAERTYIVRHPLRQALLNFVVWMGSEFVFVPINARFGVLYDSDIATTIFMGAITTCGLSYLMAERLLRPINAMAFEDGLPTDRSVPGIKSRLLLAWGIGTGVPLLGVVMMTVDHGSRPVSLAGLAFLGLTGLLSGALATVFAAKTIADPIESVTAALAEVQDGRLDTTVQVYDGSQVGQLQAGFNAMVDGLRERRRLRDLFGRQVGEDVAEQALERGVRLGGEQVHVAVLFVDVIDSTTLAATRSPAEVVAVLNAFFGIVVDVVGRTGGFVNKFEGDAALCIFGAPVRRDDAESCALLAARLMCQRLSDVNGLKAAIGVSAGDVVAGNIGTKERFEYTVIGDAVNEAARLTELAKTRPERLLACASMLESVDLAERAHWRTDGSVLLRGRQLPTQLAVAG
ncbi:MAG: adenylate cyclase [Frankiaceae bacterium]|nr:adenylate cyclase [Frankiaceae bacterium]